MKRCGTATPICSPPEKAFSFRRSGEAKEVAKDTHAKWLIIVSAHDHTVYPGPALAWPKAVGAATYISDTPCGHLIMECDAEQVSERVEKFLAQ